MYYMIFLLFFNFCRSSGASGNGVALGKVWGYPKRKTDPIFEIPTVENHRIDVLHNFFTFFSIFAVTAALAATALPLGRPGGILKEKLIPFLKSPPLKTIELMYYTIFLLFIQFLPLQRRWRQRRRFWEGLGIS